MRFPYDGDKIRHLREEALYSRELLARMARTTMTTVIKADSHGSPAQPLYERGRSPVPNNNSGEPNMNNRIDRCLGEGLLSPSKYFDLTEVGLDYFAIDPETRFHEAGHAVVGYLQGRRIKHVYAAPFDEEAWDAFHKEYFTQHLEGQVAYEDDDDRPFPSDGDDAAKARWLKDEMLSTMGAGVAVCRFKGEGEPAEELSYTDQRWIYGDTLLDYCFYAGAFADRPFDMPDEPTESEEERWWEWTYERMDVVEAGLWAEVEQMLLSHWHLVEGLAAALGANAYLDGTEVHEVFERIEARRAAAA